MINNCKDNKPCGCDDQPLTTQPPCESGTAECPNPDPCPETFSAGCVVYTGDSIVDIGAIRGERLSVILQRLALMITNPSCITVGSSCLSVVGLHSTSITSTSVSLSWLAASTATGYQVEFKEVSALSWTLANLLSNTQLSDQIIGLTPDTEYDFRVNAFCGGSSCYSVTIRLRTKE